MAVDMLVFFSSKPDLDLFYSLLRYIVGFFSSPSSPSFPDCSSPRKSALTFADYMRSHFFVFQPKALYSPARDYLSELRRATFPEESHFSFCSTFSSTEFLAAATNFFSSTASGPDKVTHSMLKHLPRTGMDFFLQVFNLYIPFLPFGKHLP